MISELLNRMAGAVPTGWAAESDFERTGAHVKVVLRPDQLEVLARFLQGDGFALTCLSGVDFSTGTDLVYHFHRHDKPLRVAVHLPLERGRAVRTLADIFESANWFEREVWEMYGVQFEGHPNLTWLLLPEGADYHPLRKDFGKVGGVADGPADIGLIPKEAG
ncbi:MAG: NADH-quinone oxidoreductase subunit C [Proteobacteria bacterium]|nr:NADH-quinone oxidoreductase subunit C [Pseudomonadota bacterium]MBU1740404.1 NADH-quinone oxidoreductase subunit C [Pseudomonadota bacterium]